MRAADLLDPGEVVVAVDLGGTSLRVGAIDRAFDPQAPPPMVRRPTRTLGPDPVDALAEAIRAAVPADRRLAGAAVGLPTQFDAATRLAEDSPNLPGLAGRDVGAELERALHAPVVVDRETVLLTQGERVDGAARGARSVLGVFIGTGIGGAFLLGETPLRGASGGAVEVGHIPVRSDGVRCVCGNLDCAEAYASGHALNAAARARRVAVEEALTHPAMADFLKGYVRDLAHAIAAAINILDPEVTVIGGGLHDRPAFPRPRLADEIRTHLRAPRPRDFATIEAARLGSEAVYAGGLHVLSHRLIRKDR